MKPEIGKSYSVLFGLKKTEMVLECVGEGQWYNKLTGMNYGGNPYLEIVEEYKYA